MLEFDKPNANHHPTMKPVALIEAMLVNSLPLEFVRDRHWVSGNPPSGTSVCRFSSTVPAKMASAQPATASRSAGSTAKSVSTCPTNSASARLTHLGEAVVDEPVRVDRRAGDDLEQRPRRWSGDSGIKRASGCYWRRRRLSLPDEPRAAWPGPTILIDQGQG
ncbi:hypothetical protein ACIA8C_01805 [Nocardia sp. NPDC051321]|uniref:hypothetical protein n=1 Tax=Nocardia sp. NPDC051321 TaxID=3364323 RepID=UPI00378845D9